MQNCQASLPKGNRSHSLSEYRFTEALVVSVVKIMQLQWMLNEAASARELFDANALINIETNSFIFFINAAGRDAEGKAGHVSLLSLWYSHRKL